jgi:hypothetical protein
MPLPKLNPKLRPLWRCPRCRKTFVTRNLWHSCRRYDLKSLFARSEPRVFRLYRRFAAMVRACGPVTINVQQSRIAFQVRVRALGCVPLKSQLRIGFAFSQRRSHPRFISVKTYGPTFHVHWISIRSEAELDAEVHEWTRAAYARSAQREPED